MFARREARLLFVIIAVIMLPTALSLAWYHYSQDPTLRPLGITQEAIERETPIRRPEVIAQLHWDRAVEGQSSDRFAQLLVQAFDIKNIALQVVVTDTPDEGSSVLYQVGASRIGPFDKANAVKGVNAAIQAYHMIVAHPRPPPVDQPPPTP
ncbi:hypothetical protein [Aliiroseovarius sediminis]|uniref:hypothetical protein n=1 Tax=Aliiroseovarius sediminis TaxID=2925839 RepID=UPI001F563A4D|nr:hypothetical protein [Aliiroseovarius sediminis]MCI2394780.1 hypothetical protein [Aliiroseovarius sediminis]